MSFSTACNRQGLFDSIHIDATEGNARFVAMTPLAATPAAAVAGVMVASAALGVAAGEAVD